MELITRRTSTRRKRTRQRLKGQEERAFIELEVSLQMKKTTVYCIEFEFKLSTLILAYLLQVIRKVPFSQKTVLNTNVRVLKTMESIVYLQTCYQTSEKGRFLYLGKVPRGKNGEKSEGNSDFQKRGGKKGKKWWKRKNHLVSVSTHMIGLILETPSSHI